MATIAKSFSPYWFIIKPVDSQAQNLRLKNCNFLIDKGAFKTLAATHIATEVTMGAHLVADITIDTSKTTKLKNKVSSGLGSLVIGPMSSAVEAGLSALLKSPPDKEDIKIDVESSHDTGGKEFKTVEEVFTFIKTRMTDSKPLKYLCVPIQQFHPGVSTVARLNKASYPIIGDHLLEPLFKMLETLKDYKAKEYYRKCILKADYRLKFILQDPKSFRYDDLIKDESDAMEAADTFYKKAVEVYDGLPVGETDAQRIRNLITEYNEEFETKLKTEIENKILEYIAIYKEQLSLINADDVEDSSEVEFYASKDRKPENTATIAIHIKTRDEGEDPPRGLFLAAYNLAKKVRVFITIPNASDEFTLTIYYPNHTGAPIGMWNIPPVLDSLSAAFGLQGGCSFRWNATVASWLGISLPIQEDTDLKRIEDLVDNVTDHWSYVVTFQTFLPLRDFILSPGNRNTLIFFIPVTVPLSSSDGKESKKIQEIHTLSMTIQLSCSWVVGDFDFGLLDGPLLMLLKDGKLVGQCYDYLDLMELHSKLETGQGDLSKWMEYSNYRPSKIPYTYQLEQLLKPGMYKTIKHNKAMYIEDASLTHIRKVVALAEAYAEVENPELHMLNNLCSQLIDKYPPALAPLEIVGWSRIEGKFLIDIISDPDILTGLIDTFESFLLNISNSMISISALLYSLEACIEDIEYHLPNEPLQEQFKVIEDMVEDETTLDHVKQIDPEGYPELKRLLSDMASTTVLENCRSAVNYLRQLLLLPNVAAEKPDTGIYFQEILQILKIIQTQSEIKEEEDEEEEETGPKSKTSHKDTMRAILTRHVMQLSMKTTKREAIRRHLESDLIPALYYEMSSLQYSEWFNEAHDLFYDNVESRTDYNGIAQSILLPLKLKSWPDEWYYIVWQNEVLAGWVYDALDDKGFFIQAKLYILREDGTIPKYIPIPIARKLLSLMEDGEEEGGTRPHDPLYPKQWETVWDALKVLQIAVVLPIEFPSSELMRILRLNLEKDKIFSWFDKAGILFFWNNAVTKYFTETWDLQVTKQAVENLMIAIKDEMDLVTPPTSIEVIPTGSETLLDLIRTNTLQTSLTTISQLQKTKEPTTLQWNKLWTDGQVYMDLLMKFLNAVEEPGQTYKFQEVDQALKLYNEKECAHLYELLLNFWKEMHLQNNSSRRKMKLTESRKSIRSLLALISDRLVQSNHFLRELYCYNQMQFAYSTPPEDIILSPLFEQLLHEFRNGYSIEFTDRYRTSINCEMLNYIQHSQLGDSRVFVVGFMGDPLKNLLKSQLFPQNTLKQTSQLTSGFCTLSLWQAPPHEMQNSVWHDAYLLVELDDLFVSNGSKLTHRILSSILLDVCDLNIIHCLESRDEFLNHLDLALCHCLTFAQAYKPNLIFASHDENDNDLISTHFKELSSMINANHFQFGVRKEDAFTNLLQRIQNNNLHNQARSQFEENDISFHHHDLQMLHEEIIKTSKEKLSCSGNPTTLSEVMQKLQTSFNFLMSHPTPILSQATVQDYVSSFSTKEKDFDRVRNLTEFAVIQHCIVSKDYISKRHTHPSTNYQETLEIVKLYMTFAGNAGICKPIGTELGEACVHCEAVSKELTTFYENHPTFPRQDFSTYRLLLSNIQFHRLHRWCAWKLKSVVELRHNLKKCLRNLFRIMMAINSNL